MTLRDDFKDSINFPLYLRGGSEPVIRVPGANSGDIYHSNKIEEPDVKRTIENLNTIRSAGLLPQYAQFAQATIKNEDKTKHLEDQYRSTAGKGKDARATAKQNYDNYINESAPALGQQAQQLRQAAINHGQEVSNAIESLMTSNGIRTYDLLKDRADFSLQKSDYLISIQGHPFEQDVALSQVAKHIKAASTRGATEITNEELAQKMQTAFKGAIDLTTEQAAHQLSQAKTYINPDSPGEAIVKSALKASQLI